MLVYVAINRADGGVSIKSIKTVVNTPEGPVEITVTGEYIQYCVNEWILTANPEWLPVTWDLISKDSIPDSVKDVNHPLQIYRNSLKFVNGKFDFDLIKARQIATTISKATPNAKAIDLVSLDACKSLEEIHNLITE